MRLEHRIVDPSALEIAVFPNDPIAISKHGATALKGLLTEADCGSDPQKVAGVGSVAFSCAGQFGGIDALKGKTVVEFTNSAIVPPPTESSAVAAMKSALGKVKA